MSKEEIKNILIKLKNIILNILHIPMVIIMKNIDRLSNKNVLNLVLFLEVILMKKVKRSDDPFEILV